MYLKPLFLVFLQSSNNTFSKKKIRNDTVTENKRKIIMFYPDLYLIIMKCKYIKLERKWA